MDKRKMIIIVVVLVLILVLLAYAMIKRSQGVKNTTGPIELTYWGLWEDSSYMDEVIAKFEDQNPNIKINYSQKRFTQYEDNLFNALDDENTTPDIVRINNTWTFKFEDKLSRVPPEIMDKKTYEDTFYTAATEDFTGSDGYLYAIPLEIDGLGMYYNIDLFARAGISKPPDDWDTLIENAIELTETNSKGEITQAGAAIGCANNINHSADILTALMLLHNVSMNSSDGTQAAFNTSRGKQALEYYVQFALNEKEDGIKIWDCGLRNDLEMFAGGKLAIMFAPSWRVFDIINMNSSVNFKTAPFPQLSGNDTPIYYGMYWGEAVSAKSPHQLEAWRFIKYLSEQEQLMSLFSVTSDYRAFGEPYSRKDLYDELAKVDYVGPFIEMAPFYKSWRIGDQTTSEEALNKAISDVVERRSQAGSAMDEAVETINTRMKSL